MATEHRIPTPDGRTLAVQEAGDPHGKPVIYHHGTPMSRLIFSGWDETAAARGVRFIAFDRPGYGESTRLEGRNVAQAADNVRVIAGHLGLERVGVIGLSGGGPHALACAALLEDLVPRVVSLAAVAPSDAEGLDWFADTGESNVEETRRFLSDRDAAWAEWEHDAAELLEMSTEEYHERYASIYSAKDREYDSGAFGEYSTAATRLGLEHGIHGPWDDEFAFVAVPWGFHPRDIRTPVRLRQGRQDLMVPYGHGAWLASQIPGVDARLSEDESHLSILNFLPEDLTWLAEAL